MGEEMMASMKNGEGGGYFMHFTCEVAVGKVLDENPLSNPHEYLDDVPENFELLKINLHFSKIMQVFSGGKLIKAHGRHYRIN